jgi:DNA-nicking Smr family endonuclease
MSKSVIHLDLHPIAKNNRALEEALLNLMEEAAKKRAKTAEVIPGKGRGQLMKRVKKFLARKEIKVQYKRLEVDSKNHGRIFIHFR